MCAQDAIPRRLSMPTTFSQEVQSLHSPSPQRLSRDASSHTDIHDGGFSVSFIARSFFFIQRECAVLCLLPQRKRLEWRMLVLCNRIPTGFVIAIRHLRCLWEIQNLPSVPSPLVYRIVRYFIIYRLKLWAFFKITFLPHKKRKKNYNCINLSLTYSIMY